MSDREKRRPSAVTSDPWGPIDPKRWDRVDCLAGRIATERDISEGRAIFCSPIGAGSIPSTAHPMSLPAPAIFRDSGSGDLVAVVVIQAERAPWGVIIGYRPLAGGSGICSLEEVELIDPSDARFA